ncbi:Maf family protein [Kushneria phosphatilytica]|uniref:dTTP/UTP pyrophosphatase n=1 Tax=Kushneria phosphatilytica TaxID=657387 RepID=A0A1S1NY19_9GAMM|nr:Maf family protein [Kushneria phosphatilytica]OHV12266.1 septum formation protein Maf [Kushneria phosphatilytica]QEL11466.1 septum formation inhibitor Maf [Kushneria phosphatilytica]
MSEQLILASASPRRRMLLETIGVSCQVMPMDIDETPELDEAPMAYVRRMACEKARAGLRKAPNGVVLGADTALSLEGVILGKPGGDDRARQMLEALSGRTHQVLSAVAVAGPAGLLSECVISEVTVAELDAACIDAYLATGEGQDKAGGYAIQGLAAAFIQRLSGSYSAVVGLPLCETAELLIRQGIAIWQPPRSA